jgi:hypothetical protein
MHFLLVLEVFSLVFSNFFCMVIVFRTQYNSPERIGPKGRSSGELRIVYGILMYILLYGILHKLCLEYRKISRKDRLVQRSPLLGENPAVHLL